MTTAALTRLGSLIPERLATVLGANTVFSAASSIVMLIFSDRLASWFEIPQIVLIAAGLAIGLFAGFVTWVAVRHPQSPHLVGLVALADLGWVVGAAAIILIPESLPPAGKVALGAVSLIVLALGLLEWLGSRRLRRS